MLVQDRAGRAVGLGTTQRTVTPALRRALTVRDGHCRFGNCTARRFLHGHHIDHWPAPTVMSNLALVCYQHHHLLHEGGWTLTGDPDHHLVATHPDGRSSPDNQPDDHDPPNRAGPPDQTESNGSNKPISGAEPSDDGDGPHRPDRTRSRPSAADSTTLFPDSG